MTTQRSTPADGSASTDALLESKRPRTGLAGPYGHPFHPILVTLPIGSWTAGLVFDVISLVVDDAEPFALGALVLVAIGLVGAVAAAVFGLLDLSRLARGTPARRIGLTHMALNLGAVALFALSLVLRILVPAGEVSVAGIVLSVLGLIVVGVSGWLGGKLAYTYGVRVADEQHQLEGFRRRADSLRAGGSPHSGRQA